MNITNTSISAKSAASSTSGTQPNLSAIIDDASGKYTDEQKAQAWGEREARDNAVIGPAFQQSLSTGDSTTPWRAALALLNSLSPEEQNSSRYKGTRQEILAAIAAGNGPSTVTSGPAGVEDVHMSSADSSSVVASKSKSKSLFGSMIYLHAVEASAKRSVAVVQHEREFGPGSQVPTHASTPIQGRSTEQSPASQVDYNA